MRKIFIMFAKGKTARVLLAASMMAGVFFFPTEASERRYKLEAAYLYNFFNYITWPGHSSPQSLESPTICIFGDDPLLYYLEYVRVKVASERRLFLRHVREGENLTGCHILFMRHRVPYGVLSSLPPYTLTVFKPDDPLDRGGMIELTEDEERLAIKIDQPQLDRAGFSTSSRLLELARVIR